MGMIMGRFWSLCVLEWVCSFFNFRRHKDWIPWGSFWFRHEADGSEMKRMIPSDSVGFRRETDGSVGRRLVPSDSVMKRLVPSDSVMKRLVPK